MPRLIFLAEKVQKLCVLCENSECHVFGMQVLNIAS